jgi:hypothetical protein
MWKVDTSKVVTPSVSVKDWWVGPASKYWTYWSHAGDMSPVNWCSLLPTYAWLFLTASMVVVGEKLSMYPQISQPACCKLEQEPFFSGAVVPFNSVDNFTIGCHIRGLPARSIWVTYVDWHRKHTCRVYQVFPTGCTLIRITTTLRYE